jgi:ABC-type Fe3+/spermidine/putrescine transport system ATPase subunit
VGRSVLKDVSFEVASGDLLALVGPSGSGKTTVLKVIAGLLSPFSGDVLFDGQSVLRVPPERRRIAMVFQKPLLFPYLDVAGNVGFGLKMQGAGAVEIQTRVARALELVHLEGFEKRKAGELSGGQEQRVALARALITEPRILLLDEPFSALDERLRTGMRTLVRDLQRSIGITTVFVTHDQQEAVEISDQIGVLMDGCLGQLGRSRLFYESPATRRIAEFFGWRAVPGTDLMFRPESARIGMPETGAVHFPGVVHAVIEAGAKTICRTDTAGGGILDVEMREGQCVRGDTVMIVVDRRYTVRLSYD